MHKPVTEDEADTYDGLGFVARRWLQLNEEAGRMVRERLKDEGRTRVRECVGWLRAMRLTEREIINMLHGMAEYLEDDLEVTLRRRSNRGGRVEDPERASSVTRGLCHRSARARAPRSARNPHRSDF